MDYFKIYEDLINKALKENRKKRKRDHKDYVYYEKHHIVPRCLGGKDKKENLVLLTAREHFVAHKLLAEVFPDERGLVYSLWMLTTKVSFENRRNYIVSSKEYERFKNEFSKLLSVKNKGEGNPNFGKIGELAPMYNKKLSQEAKDKIGMAHKGKTISEEHKQRLRDFRTGRTIPEEQIKRQRLTWKKKEKNIRCPWCNFLSNSVSNMKRYHFDNCKQNPNYKIEDHLITCPWCNKIAIDNPAMYQYHFDNCLENPKNNKEELKELRKISNPMYGKRFKQKLVTCPHCNKTGGISPMKHHHFDNCKFKK